MRGAALLLVALLAGCERKIADPPPGAVISDEKSFVRSVGPAPLLVTYKPASAGGPEVFREAIVGGVLDLAGPCVRVQGADGAMRLVVTIAGSALRRDSLGWFLPAGDDRLRHGATVESGGGELPAPPAAALLAVAVPPACAGPTLEMSGIRRWQPRSDPSVAVPPPPAR